MLILMSCAGACEATMVMIGELVVAEGREALRDSDTEASTERM